MKIISQNRRARHLFSIEETFEAGLVLTGTEVKALRQGSANLGDGYGLVEGDEVFLYSLHIPTYEYGHQQNHEPLRTRKLLLKQPEIKKIKTKITERGFSLIPLKLYFNNRGLVKLEIALAKGKKKYDKRDVIDRDRSKRELREVKHKQR